MERPLILCRAALAFLTGFSIADIPSLTPMIVAQEETFPLHQEAFAHIQSWYAAGAPVPLWLLAPDGCGRRTLLGRACGGAACLDLAAMNALSVLERDRIFRETVVTARLMSVPVCAIYSNERDPFTELERLCIRFQIPLAVLAQDSRALRRTEEVVRLSNRLSPQERKTAWYHFSPQAEPDTCPDGNMTVGALRETARLAQRIACDTGRKTVSRACVQQAVRLRGSALEFGLQYDPTVTLEDLVLPDNVREQITLICQMARSGDLLDAWGLPRRWGSGIMAVFHGPSGTGKTMAAEAIAGSLGLPLLRADLSQLMDKYVGETEKHLARLLLCARESRCVLLFDEADALFGKRAEVSTGHDKYANLSTSYLLQEMERYEGIALLSTNLLSNFDEAFLRRLHYVVRFPMPDATLREILWRRALPPERLEGEIPYTALARAELSPARINSAARNAAAAALAGGHERVDAKELVLGLRWELGKNNKPLPRGLNGEV